MHSLTEVGTNVPAFLAKLWKLVEDQETNDLICWSENGSSFTIHNQAQFCRELLPLYYKHNNMASFVRQLNMYGFHKKVSVDAGGLKLDRDEMEFAHPCFLRGQAFLLENIKRKIAEPGRGTVKAPEVINRVLGDVKQMKGRQENLDSKLTAMKRENEALWRELALLRQKHLKQQQIVNKLIQFLLTVVQSPGSRLGIKRRYPPLMLNDREHHHHHHHKHKHRSGQPSTSGSSVHVSSSAPSSPPPHRHPFSDDEAAKAEEVRTGPVIHELDPNSEYILPDEQHSDEEMEEEAEVVTGQVTTPPPVATATVSSLEQDARSPPGLVFEPEAVLPEVLPEALLEEASSSSTADQAGQMALLSQAGTNGPSLGGEDSCSSSVSREELDSHLEAMQSDLEGLKELLRSDSCSLDANTLLSLFAEDPISLGMGLPSQEGKDDDADVIGSELIAYNPTLFDLTDEADVGGASQLFEGGDDQGSLLGVAEQTPTLESIVQAETETELATPHPRLEPPDFSEPSKKRRK